MSSIIDKFVEEAFSDEANCSIALEASSFDKDHFNDLCEQYYIEMKLVDSFSSDDLEDCGNVWSVYELNFNNGQEVIYIRFNGYYSSYIGVNYYSKSYVTPKQVKSIEWV